MTGAIPLQVHFVRCTLLINRAAGGVATNPASQVKVNSMFVEDVTSRQASETSAVASQSSSAVASSSAAAAQKSAIQSANVGQGALNQNSGFDDYPSATVGALPGGYHTRSGNALPYRVPDPQGGYALRYPSIAGEQGYIRSDNWKINPNVVTDGYYVLSAEAIAHVGTFSGSAFMVRAYNSAVSAYQDLALFPNEYQPAPVIGRAYSFNKLVKVTLPDAFGFEQFTFAHWAVAAAGSIANANEIEWRKALIRPATPEEVATNEVLPPLQAIAIANSGAIASIEDTAAFLEQIVAASGGNPAVFRMLAGKNGATMTLAGDRILMLNYVSGELVEVARFEGGVARLNQALIRDLSVAPTPVSGIYHKVQLQPIILTGGDGAVLQYQGGASYGGELPRIEPTVTGLPALNAGESYDIRATNITDSQFTARVKKLVAGGPTAQTSGNFSDAGSGTTPRYQTNKPTAAEAYDGSYQFTFTANLPKLYEYQEVPGEWTAEYRGTFDIYGKSAGGVWTKIGTTTGLSSSFGYSPGLPNSATRVVTANVQSSLDMGTGSGHFGVHPTSDMTSVVTGTGTVEYSTQTATSEAAVSGLIKWTVYPPS